MTTRSLFRKSMAVLVSTVLGACAIQPDSAPRDIPADLQERETPSAAAAGGAARGSDRIYLLAPGDPERPLRTVPRDTRGNAERLLTALIRGPNPAEVEAGFRSAIPADLSLRSARVEDGVAQVDVNDALLGLSGSDLIDAVAQIVFTASELPGASSVLIRVDGATGEWPDGAGVQQRAPLTVYDFIGYAESSQPAFPVAPTPTVASTTSVPTSSTAPTPP